MNPKLKKIRDRAQADQLLAERLQEVAAALTQSARDRLYLLDLIRQAKGRIEILESTPGGPGLDTTRAIPATLTPAAAREVYDAPPLRRVVGRPESGPRTANRRERAVSVIEEFMELQDISLADLHRERDGDPSTEYAAFGDDVPPE